jgi:syntaxin-binding protein 5
LLIQFFHCCIPDKFLISDRHSRIRLIALYTSGLREIYTITQSDGSALWICEGPISAEGVANPLPQGSFVINCKTGNQSKASRNESTHSTSATATRCAFVTCGSKGAKCFANITGAQISKTDWGGKIGIVQGTQIVERLGEWLYILISILTLTKQKDHMFWLSLQTDTMQWLILFLIFNFSIH